MSVLLNPAGDNGMSQVVRTERQGFLSRGRHVFRGVHLPEDTAEDWRNCTL